MIPFLLQQGMGGGFRVNPSCVPMRVVWSYTSSDGHTEFTSKISEALTPQFAGAEAFYFYRFPKEGRLPLYRMTTKDGERTAYSINQRRGQRHTQIDLLGYFSTTQKTGMIPVTLPPGLFLVDDSRAQAAFEDFEHVRAFAYPAEGIYNEAGETLADSHHLIRDTLVYSSANYDHIIELNSAGPHIYRWHVADTVSGLDIELVNIGHPPTNDNSQGGGLGRGIQFAYGFQDFQGFESDEEITTDPNHECLTVHNPNQAGSGPANWDGLNQASNGATSCGSIYLSKEIGADFFDISLKVFDFIEVAPIPSASPQPIPPAPCATEWHGQHIEGEDQVGGGLWEELTVRQFLEMDIQGREGVHRLTYEFTTPRDIESFAWKDTTAGVFNFTSFVGLNNAFDDGYFYDPINHAAPIHMNAYTFPGLSADGRTVTGFKDMWSINADQDRITGASNIQIETCTGVVDSISNADFVNPPVPPTTEPRFQSQRASAFLRSRFPAAAAPNDRFGFGMAAGIAPRGIWNSMGWTNQRAACNADLAAEYTDVHPFTNTLQLLGLLFQRIAGTFGGSVIFPAGTTKGEIYLILDTFANFQGHVDWLESQGLI